MSRLSTVALFLLLILIWGATYSILKVGLEYAPPLTFAGLRAVVGLAGLLPVVLLRRSGLPTDPRLHLHALLLGLTNMAGFFGLLSVGMTQVSSGESAVLVYTQPLIVAVLARYWLAERLTWWKSLGLLLGFGGVVALLAEKINPASQTTWWAYLAVLGSAFSWSLGTIYFKRHQTRLDPLQATTLQNLYGGAVLLAVALVLERPTIQLTLPFWLTLLYVGLGSSSIAYLVWFRLLAHGEASMVSTYIFLVPLTATLIGAVFLSESLGPLAVLGVLLTLSGIYLANRTAPARPAASAALHSGVGPAHK